MRISGDCGGLVKTGENNLNARIQVRHSPSHSDLDYYHAEYLNCALLDGIPLYPFCVEDSIRTKPTFFYASRSDFLQIIINLEGVVRYSFHDRRITLRPGSLLLVPIDSEYGFETKGRIHKLVLEIKGPALGALSEMLGLNRVLLLTPPSVEPLVESIREIGVRIKEGKLPSDYADLFGSTYGLLILLSFYRKRRNRRNSLFTALLQSLDQPSETVEPMTDIAKRLNVSTSTLNRLCRSGLKCSPSRHRLIRRLERAGELLANTSYSIKEIAQKTGYCNQFYFSSEFKRHFKVSPSEWRKHLKPAGPGD